MMRVCCVLLCVILLSGCDPIKRTERRQKRLDAAVSDYLRRNPPRADTMYLPGDTIYHTDTIVNENIYVDTVRVNDTVYITKVNWREYLTTAYVRDTIIRKVSDCAEYTHFRDESMVMQDRWQRERRRSKAWMWAVFALAAVIIGSITYKVVRHM